MLKKLFLYALILVLIVIPLVGISQSVDGAFKTITASGTNTYTTVEPLPATYTLNERFLVRFTNANTGASTFNRAGIGAIPIKKPGGIDLASGDIQAGEVKILSYNGTYYQLVGGSGSGGGGVWGSITGTLSSQADLSAALALKATLISPVFTGAPTAPTPSANDNSTKIATTAYVDALSSVTAGNVVIGNASNVATGTPLTGVLSVTSAGVTSFNIDRLPVTGTATLTGSVNYISNSPNQFNWAGTWPATANNQYHSLTNPSITARPIAGDAVYGSQYKPTLTAAAATQHLYGFLVDPVFVPGAFSPTMHLASFRNGGNMVFDITSTYAQFTNLGSSLQVSVNAAPSGSTSLTVQATGVGGRILDGMRSSGANIMRITGTGGGRWGISSNINSLTTDEFFHDLDPSFSASNLTADVNMIIARPTYNFTGTGAVATRAFLYNPTKTALTGVDYGIIIQSTTSKSGFGNAAPTSMLHTTAFATAYVSKTANYTITDQDHSIEVTSGSSTQTLPSAVGIAGRFYYVTNSGTGTVTLATTSSQTFANVATTPTSITIPQYGGVLVKSNGSNWLLMSNIYNMVQW